MRAFLLLVCLVSAAAAQDSDVILRNGAVIDGTGRAS